MLDCCLPKLCRYLRRRVVYELPILTEEVPRGSRALLLLLRMLLLLRVRVPIASLLGLVRHGGRRRP